MIRSSHCSSECVRHVTGNLELSAGDPVTSESSGGMRRIHSACNRWQRTHTNLIIAIRSQCNNRRNVTRKWSRNSSVNCLENVIMPWIQKGRKEWPFRGVTAFILPRTYVASWSLSDPCGGRALFRKFKYHGTFLICLPSSFDSFFLRFYLFFRERGREGNIYVRNTDWLPLTHAPTGDRTHNPGKRLDWELNRWPFALWDDTQASHTSQGQWESFLNTYLFCQHLKRKF